MEESFETYRPYLFSIAYRMLGSAMDAEDMVQETYIRSSTPPKEPIRSFKAYLTTIISRLCVDQLQLARKKRELYVGPWLPEPILTATDAEAADPEKRVEAEESISCRRSFSRAKQHLREQRPRFPVAPQIHQQLLSGYFQAVQQGEMAPLMNMLAENVTLWTDGGGKAPTAALRPIHGRDAVARMSLGSRRFWPEGYCAEVAEVNGQPAMIIRAEDQAFAVVTIEVEDQQIQTIHVIVNPEKLERI
jgi:RNA polymerase sigma-70 factor, ECF subfamily